MVKKFSAYLFFLLLTSVVLLSCARQGTLSGGPKDLQAPKLIVEKSDSNFQTNFYPQQIVLHFDEWLQLKNQSQILISPPLKLNHKVQVNGKKVEFEFDEEEVLRDSTTYSINFGNAIVDFNESNPIENFQFIFSTGDKIDSLMIRGKVVDSYSKKGIKDVSVMLYDQNIDSLVYTEKPYYFARTDKSGSFMIKNMRSGYFKCFALLDADFDYLYNQESEQIGFLDSMLYVHPDSFVNIVNIELFLPEPELRFNEIDLVKRGKIKMKANREIDQYKLVTSNIEFFEEEILEDSLILWYQPDTLFQDSIHFAYNLGNENDTILLKSKNNTSQIGKMNYASFKQKKIRLVPGDSLVLKFNQPVRAVDTSLFKLSIFKEEVRIDTSQQQLPDSLSLIQTDSLDTVLDSIQIVQDSIELEEVIDSNQDLIPFSSELDTLNPRQIILTASFDEDQKYDLLLLPGAISGYFGNSNDSLETNVIIENKENLGNIYCKFDSLDNSIQYVVYLKQKTLIIQKDLISNVSSTQLQYLLVKPGKYSLEIIEDLNRNGRWDPGNYEEKRQSERKLDVTLEELRKNWDIESEIKWDK